MSTIPVEPKHRERHNNGVRISVVTAAAVAGSLAAVPAAAGKDFRPGDLRLCDARKCVPITNQRALDAMSRLYYGSTRLIVARAPRLGTPTLRLEFENGYATGIVGSKALDRFLSYGVNTGRLRRATWYRVPVAAATHLRALASKLRPQPLTRAAIARSR